ncbi:MAG: hypothetical protein ACI8W3_001700, partial [Myxococcota bacterium]
MLARCAPTPASSELNLATFSIRVIPTAKDCISRLALQHGHLQTGDGSPGDAFAR